MAAVVLAGCYAPSAQSGAPCDLSIDNCPSGQRCTMTGSGAFCLATTPDQNVDGSTTNTDGKPAPSCFGTGVVRDVCNLNVSADVDVAADRVINTAMVGAPNCDAIIAQPSGGPSMCVVAAGNFNIATGAKLSATGANPLLLVAANSFTIAGTLDVASHITSNVIGPGASTTCGNGTAGGTGGNPDGAGGGGAGGSFGTSGANGGVGFNSSTNNPGGPGGIALAPVTPAALVGGCPGGNGGDGSGGGGGGPGVGGRGGGGVYVIAGESLVISGTINASGAGGGPGKDSLDASAGAGGGGSGGFIGLDAPSMSITGTVFANGGSGGGGGGNMPAGFGSRGNDPTNATTPAAGGNGGAGGGGNGGAGFANGNVAATGANGSSLYCAAGGGGGGAGIIRVYGVTPSGGTFSPPPT